MPTISRTRRSAAAMTTMFAVSVAAAAAGIPAAAHAYPTAPATTIYSIAGDGHQCAPAAGSCGGGPVATAAQLSTPTGVAIDGSGSVYVADYLAHKIRKITPAGVISTVAGNGHGCADPTASCGDGPTATGAQLSHPVGVAVDAGGNVYIADTLDHKIRKVTPAGAISTIAGTGEACGDPESSCGDGPNATAARFSYPSGVAVDAAGNVYVADSYNDKVRRITPGRVISTLAGTGRSCATPTDACGDGSLASAADLRSPTGVAVDTAGNVYIADAGDHKVREVTAGMIATVAGDGEQCAAPTGACGDGASAPYAQLAYPNGISVDSRGNIYIADSADNKVRVVTPAGQIATVAGTGSACLSSPFCGDGGAGTSARLSAPAGVAIGAGGDVFVADSANNLIRWLSGPQAGPGGSTGAPGSTGPTGSAGAAGQGGTAGTTGPAGTAGTTGATGTSGVNGQAGAAGPAGATGPIGMVKVTCKTAKPIRGKVKVTCSVKPAGKSRALRVTARLAHGATTLARAATGPTTRTLTLRGMTRGRATLTVRVTDAHGRTGTLRRQLHR